MNPAAKSIRILLVDDSPIIRLGLRSALEDCADLKIIGEAGTAAEGLDLVNRLTPDVVMLDLNLPDKSGLMACRDYLKARPFLAILILTSSSNEHHMREAISSGARGYLLKENEGAVLARALRTVARGESVLDPSMAAQVLSLVRNQGAQTPADRIASLSPQERRVVALLAGGKTNKEIGLQLGLTEKTIKNYLATIFSKWNITRRTQAAAIYVEAGHGPNEAFGDNQRL